LSLVGSRRLRSRALRASDCVYRTPKRPLATRARSRQPTRQLNYATLRDARLVNNTSRTTPTSADPDGLYAQTYPAHRQRRSDSTLAAQFGSNESYESYVNAVPRNARTGIPPRRRWAGPSR